MSVHRAPGRPHRWGCRLVVLLVLLSAVPVGVALASAPPGPHTAASSTVTRGEASGPDIGPGGTGRMGGTESPLAARVLHRWDAARAAAYARADVVALRRLYTARSVAGARDVALLESYVARGLTVEDLKVQVFALRVLGRDRGRLVLAVTDRVSGATAVGERGRWRLPADDFTSRVLTFRSAGGRWLLSAVRPRSGP